MSPTFYSLDQLAATKGRLVGSSQSNCNWNEQVLFLAQKWVEKDVDVSNVTIIILKFADQKNSSSSTRSSC